ncbi:leucine-rich repeat domain-containing protein [Candidatus Albibeggiatoa sp. nov. NOAA]|uniref:leucine-rich repeat domain-containing protein n=1 Tax=Candidatus Albibeggiatoa sp. nov. NOAA TaxID=3162724 RepID=UPI0032FC780F|nr:leucine-rich repeat domain-containing protein [Thiotrichaceae bacterium]
MTIQKPWYIYSVLLYLCISPLLLHADECSLNQCQYTVPFNQAGYYLVKVSLPESGGRGMWKLAVSVYSADNQPVALQSINTGAAALQTSNTSRVIDISTSWTTFRLSEPQTVSLTPYNYDDNQQAVLAALYRHTETEKMAIYEPTLVNPEQTLVTPLLEAGLYTAEIANPNKELSHYYYKESKLHTGLSVQAHQLSSISNGGWIDPDSPEGFISFSLLQPSTVQFDLSFSDTFINDDRRQGSTQPLIHVDFINAVGERQTVWQTSLSDLEIARQLKASTRVDIDNIATRNYTTWVGSEVGQKYDIDDKNNVIALSLGNHFNVGTAKEQSFPPLVPLLTHLSTLILNQANITDIPTEIGQLKDLTTLDLSSNYLSQFPIAILQLTQLQTLDLRSAYVNVERVDIPSEINQLVNLQHLNLVHNYLYELPEGISQLPQLTELIAYNNHLTTLPASFGQLTQLQILDLSYNDFTSMPDSLYALPSLSELHLSNNQISALSPNVAQLQNLTYLNARQNQLTSLPAEIGQLSNLTKLVLDRNQLQTLPAEIGLLQNLTYLNLSNNQLTALPPEMGNLRDDLRLYIGGNTQLISPPLDIAQQGIPAIRKYFANQ